jgi:uncharacterized membrane protein
LHQYSLPIIPFLVVFVIANLSQQTAWVRRPRWIMMWSAVSFIALAKYSFFAGTYLTRFDQLPALTSAIAQVQSSADSVLTSSYFVPHLTHRSRLEYTKTFAPPTTLAPYQSILLNLQDPGWGSSTELTQQVFERVQQDPQFQLTWQRDRVYLFQRQGARSRNSSGSISNSTSSLEGQKTPGDQPALAAAAVGS